MKPYLAAAACAAALTAAHADGGNYALDPTHTFVTFEVPHFGVTTNRGRLGVMCIHVLKYIRYGFSIYFMQNWHE